MSSSSRNSFTLGCQLCGGISTVTGSRGFFTEQRVFFIDHPPSCKLFEQAFQSGHPLTQVGDVFLQIANSDPVTRDRGFK